ncbi:MAG: histidine kinase [Ilumatobacteraceae bacterium]|nr:histidine kinase [Ilumatobacteraceae bacterium]
MARGSLRIYLGASPGVGKTFAMLDEGFRRRERGADVVIGIVETHGRAGTAAQIRDLEVVPRAHREHRGTTVQEMDLDAVLVRRPRVVLVDEFAHTNAPGSRNDKRWQDVEALLDAGIDVISTLNIQHLESLNDVVTRITGMVQRETVPDAVVRRADQIELVDMSPEAVRRRMAHGNIYPAERVDAALSNWFRPGNLGALRELALLWVADRVEESLSSYLVDHGITDAWETRERVVVGITGGGGGEALIRRAARISGRVGGELIGVHVVSVDGLVGTPADSERLAAQRRLVDELGGTVRDVAGGSLAEALVAFARAEKATQLVLGATRRSRWYEVWRGSLVARVTRLAGDIDVHVIAQREPEESEPTGGTRLRVHAPVDPRRIWWAWVLTVVGLPALCALGVAFRDGLALESELLVFLAVVLLIAAIGGRLVGAVASVVASLLVNWFFVEPLHTLTVADPDNLVALMVFVAVAITVGSLVDSAARRSLDAARARVEAEALARAAATMAADPDPMPQLAEQLRTAAGLDAVRISRRVGDAWTPIAAAGSIDDTGSTTPVPVVFAIGSPGDDSQGQGHGQGQGQAQNQGGSRHRLELYGRPLSADDQRMLRALVDQLAVAIDHQELAREAIDISALAEIDAVRTALLRAVSHDLRTPLSSIKAMVSGLLDRSVQWTDEQLAEALATIDEETDRLNRLVGNLLDASRLQIGALAMNIVDVDLAEAVAGALDSVGPVADDVAVELPADLPMVKSDMVLLERSLANIVSNAVRHGGRAGVRITAGTVGDEVRVCIVDRGPGIPLAQRERVMAPFQRLGDQQTADGVGLGMSIAQGFISASGGSLTLDDTPGGGLTVTMSLRAGSPAASMPERTNA